MPSPFNRVMTQYVYGRLFEWTMAVNMTLLGLTCAVFPEALQVSAFRFMIFVGDPRLFGIVALVIGNVRVLALVINGRSIVYGPHVRAACAVFGTMIWFQMLAALVMYSITIGYPSPGVSNWLSLCIGELFAAYLAGRDVRRGA
jgi:hypothetical protein